jgi:hypothetical protein
MGRISKLVTGFVVVLGIVGIVLGIAFIYKGTSTYNLLQTDMRAEKITLGISTDKIAAGEVIDTLEEAKIAADTIREHRHGISPTYGDLLAGKKFDPANPTQLTYAQAMNLENYLYLAVAAFGLATVTTYTGIFMVVTGVALGAGALLVALKLRNKTKV